MNNHHLFLIRSNSVTQISAHLVAGLLALVLVTSMIAPKADNMAAHRPVAETTEVVMSMPAGTTLLAATR